AAQRHLGRAAEAPRAARGHRAQHRARHSHAADDRRARSFEPSDRRSRDGGAAPPRRRRVRALRVGVSKLPGRHRVPARDRAAAVPAKPPREPRADVAFAGRRRTEKTEHAEIMNTASHAAVARDRAYMAEALALAANGLYDTKPNPAVGCVLVKNGRVIARGWTAPAGGPPAQRSARQAGRAER